jgi:hypothetical protein
MRRREFITLLGGIVVAGPLGAGAQDAGRTYRIGFLLPSTRDSLTSFVSTVSLKVKTWSLSQEVSACRTIRSRSS